MQAHLGTAWTRAPTMKKQDGNGCTCSTTSNLRLLVCNQLVDCLLT